MMTAPTHLIPTYPTDDEVVYELSQIGLKARASRWEGLKLSPDASRQIIAWAQAEWDRRQREGGA